MPRGGKGKKFATITNDKVGESSTSKKNESEEQETQVMETNEDVDVANDSTEETTENEEEQEVTPTPSESKYEFSEFKIDPPAIPDNVSQKRQRKDQGLFSSKKFQTSPRFLRIKIGETKKSILEYFVNHNFFYENDKNLRSSQAKSYMSTDSWENLHISSKIIEKFQDPKLEFLNPTKIQSRFLPILFGGSNVIVRSDFESGKTLGSLLYCGEKIRENKNFRVLFLTASYETQKQADYMSDLVRLRKQNIIFTPVDLCHELFVKLLKLPLLDFVVLDNADRLFELYPTELNDIFQRIKYNQVAILTNRMIPQIEEIRQNAAGDSKFEFVEDDSQAPPKSIPQSYHILPNYSSFITTMNFYFTTHASRNFFVLFPTKHLALTYYYIFESILSSSVVGFCNVDHPTFDRRIMFAHFLSMRTPEKFDMIMTVGCPTDIVDYVYRVEYSSNPHAQSLFLLHEHVDDLTILEVLTNKFQQPLEKEVNPPQTMINTTLSSQALRVVADFPQNVFYGTVWHRKDKETLNYDVIAQSLLELPKYFNVEPNKIPVITNQLVKDALDKYGLLNKKVQSTRRKPRLPKRKAKSKPKKAKSEKKKEKRNNRNDTSQPKKVSKQQEKGRGRDKRGKRKQNQEKGKNKVEEKMSDD